MQSQKAFLVIWLIEWTTFGKVLYLGMQSCEVCALNYLLLYFLNLQAKDRICRLVQSGISSGARLVLDGRHIVVCCPSISFRNSYLLMLGMMPVKSYGTYITTASNSKLMYNTSLGLCHNNILACVHGNFSLMFLH